jgi:hypothetical protein
MTLEHRKKVLKVHMPPALARKILVEWANLRGEPSDQEYAELINICPKIFRDAVWLELAESDERRLILSVREHLRVAWNAPDLQSRQWFIFRLRHEYGHLAAAKIVVEQDTKIDKLLPVSAPPPISPFDDVLTYFLSIIHKALRCTRDGCETPYFIKGKGVRTQRYCEKCGVLVRRDQQNKYWEETGKELRQNRRRKAKQGKRK